MPAAKVDTRQQILDTAQAIMARKGYAAVGLNEVLSEAGVPKGSFYHWFSSKETFGEELMKSYFTNYLSSIDRIGDDRERSGAERLMEYWQRFYDLQSFDNGQGKCLVVKLAAEVSDLSEPMRLQLVDGTVGIVDRLERFITDGIEDGSLKIDDNPRRLAQELYDSWLGASIMAKVQRSHDSLQRVMDLTRTRLRL
ncbi:TetR/AcrR family transcriptional regulator [Rhodococcus sp. 077-4]|uniref:TetR/AcrR family transcriptional regulator n=1 Tax=Rhodococcus sp. 077-4 TaxID=2789271 RepID=UPI0039F4A0D7